MGLSTHRITRVVWGCFLLASLTAAAMGQDVSSTPSSLSFPNTYVGLVSGSKVLTITNLLSQPVIINSVSFTCPQYGLAAGTAPTSLFLLGDITHYSIFFQPTAAATYNCNFVMTMADGTQVDVPLTATGKTTTAVGTVSPASLSFPNQTVGTQSAPQTVTVTNTGGAAVNITAITLTPPSFSTPPITLPYSLAKTNGTLSIPVYYTPSQVTSETGVIAITYDALPVEGTSLSGNGVAASSLVISSSPTLPQATQNSAYQATLATSGGVGPYTWSVASGSTLPSGLTLSSAGILSGTLASSVGVGTYTFTIQVTDTSTNATASTLFNLGVYAALGDSCNDISFNDPVLGTPMIALTDLGTGFYEGNTQSGEGGLYPNGSNVRPAGQDAYGVTLAQGIQPLDTNGNPSPTGKYVLLAIGESTAQNAFTRFLPIANADPTKNPSLVLVNGAQGGATPNNFTITNSPYWSMVINNYLPQNGVSANQVVAIWIEDTDGIATGSFPTDLTTLQSEYETMMQIALTDFPNLKLVYFSSRVYGGYSNGVATINPEPYSYEVGFAVKWAIADQLNGASNLCDGNGCSPINAPWMSWGPYYWSNGMAGRKDGLVWDCEDFSSDGTHPSYTFGQLKVATELLSFLKSDDTTKPWYLAPIFSLTPTAGNNQSGAPGTTLPTSLTVLASNLNSGVGISGVTVNFNDGGVGGTFGTPVAITGSNGTASSTYTLPSTAQTVTVTATSSGYAAATFTEIANNSLILSPNGGNNQTGGVGSTLPTALKVLATNNGNPVSGVSVNFSDGGAGGTFGSSSVITGTNGTASTTYTLPATAKTVTITASSTGYGPATFTETAAVWTLSTTGGNNQSGMVGTVLPTALSVLATSNGLPASGVSVSFSDGGAGGTFGTPTAVTGSNGTASTTYTPETVGAITVTATSFGYTSSTLTETGTPLVTTLTDVSGGKQSGTVGTTLPLPIVMKAKDASGKAVAGAPITYTDGGLGGTFSPNPGITGSNGQASTTYTLPTVAKIIAVTGTDGSVHVSATETSLAGPATTLSIVSGNNQTGTHGKALAKKLIVSVTDKYNNPISGVSVTFTDNGAGGTFSTKTPVTGTNGQASVTYTCGTKTGTITISASTSTLGPVNFTETVQ